MHLAAIDEGGSTLLECIGKYPQEIFKELMEEIKNGVAAPKKVWEEAIKSKQNRVRQAWLATADALERAGASQSSAESRLGANPSPVEENRELAETMRRFVSAMPSIDTERHLMKKALIQELTQKPEKHLANAHAEIRHPEADRNGMNMETVGRPSHEQAGAKQPVRGRDKDLER